MQVECKSLMTAWLHVNVNSNEPLRAALLPRQTIHIAAFNVQGGIILLASMLLNALQLVDSQFIEMLFGTTHSVLELLTDSRSIMVCEHLTLLPPSVDFLQYALACQDWNPNRVIASTSNRFSLRRYR